MWCAKGRILVRDSYQLAEKKCTFSQVLHPHVAFVWRCERGQQGTLFFSWTQKNRSSTLLLFDTARPGLTVQHNKGNRQLLGTLYMLFVILTQLQVSRK